MTATGIAIILLGIGVFLYHLTPRNRVSNGEIVGAGLIFVGGAVAAVGALIWIWKVMP